MKKMVWFFVIIPVLFISFHPVQAEEKKAATDGPWERGSIRLGAFLATGMSSDVTFGIEDIGLGIVLDMEDALGLDSSMQVLKGDLLYRFGSSRRHNFSFAWSSYHRDATRELLKGREINGKPISVGTDLHSKFNFDIFKAGYAYSFFHDDRMNLSVGGGLYVMPIEIELKTENEKIADDISITAPLPVVMVNGEFAITPKWFLKLGMELFYIEINNFTGSIFDASAAIEYNAWKHVGFGLSVEFFNASIKAENKDAWLGADFIGDINFDLNGLMLYTKFYW